MSEGNGQPQSSVIKSQAIYSVEEPDSPLKRAKHDGRFDLPAVTAYVGACLVVIESIIEIHILGPAMPYGEGDEAREPEEHGQGV